MKKRMLTMLLAFVMIVSVLPFQAMAWGYKPAKCDHIKYGTKIVTVASTCKQSGTMKLVCKNDKCGFVFWEKSLPLANHTYNQYSKCTVCGKVCTKHSYGDAVTVAATCTQNGSETKTCLECGHKDVKTLRATGHRFDKFVQGKRATCTEDGYNTHWACSKCGEAIGRVVDQAKGHDYKTTYNKDATCTTGGIVKKECRKCHDRIEDKIDATGHNYTDVEAKNPTCTEGGHNAYQECSKCGHKKGYVPAAAKGHNFVNGKCACGATAPNYSGPSFPIFGCRHSSTSTYSTSADCTVPGFVVVTCNTCHAEISREIQPAKGHETETITLDPTCTENGFTREICTVCKTVVSNTIKDKLGHNHVNGICTRCGGADASKYTPDLQGIHVVGGPAY